MIYPVVAAIRMEAKRNTTPAIKHLKPNLRSFPPIKEETPTKRRPPAKTIAVRIPAKICPMLIMPLSIHLALAE